MAEIRNFVSPELAAAIASVGYAVVPVEPTEEMVRVAKEVMENLTIGDYYGTWEIPDDQYDRAVTEAYAAMVNAGGFTK